MELRNSIFLWLGVCSSAYSFTNDDPGIDWKNIKRPSHEQAIHEIFPRQADFEQAERLLNNHPRNRPVAMSVTRYALYISVNPENGWVHGTSIVYFKARAETLESITLDTYDMQISKVSIDNQDVPFVYDGDTVQVKVPNPLGFGEQGMISVQYSVKRSQSFFLAQPDAVNPKRMLGAYTFTQPEESRKWFPCVDRPFAKAPFDLYLTVPEGYNALSNGNLITRESITGGTLFHYQIAQPIAPYLVSLAIGRYEIHKIGEYKGKPLTLWTPPAIAAAAKQDTARTQKMMETISQFTGIDYPFSSYAQSVAQAWEVSMEHQSATTLGSWVITGDALDEATIVHELAHQWFGNYVTPETWSDLWLSEGFATYLPYIFFEENHSHNKALGEIDDWRDGYFSEAKNMVHALSPAIPDIDGMFDAHAYEKGALVVKFMRWLANRTKVEENEENFRKVVSLYLRSHAYKTVRHVDLQKALETITQQSWQTFFDQWVRSPGHPELNVKFENKNDEVIVSVTQVQSIDPEREWPTFQFPIEVDFFASDGMRVRKALEVYNSTQEFRFKVGFKVVGIDFDPDWQVPAEVEVQQDLSGRMTVLKYSPSERARIDAMRWIFKHHETKPEAFFQLLLADQSLYLKADALDKLTKQGRNRAIVERLVANLQTRDKDWDRTIRTLVASAQAWLVKTRGRPLSPQEEDALQAQFRHGPLTVGERKAILEKLSSLSLPRTQQFARERLQESFWSMRDRANLVDVLVKIPTDTSLPFILDALKSTGIYWFRYIALSLVSAEYDEKALVPILVDRAKTSLNLSSRKFAVDLLAVQKSSRTVVCSELRTLSVASESNPDRLEEIRAAAKNALENLECSNTEISDARAWFPYTFDLDKLVL